jgi:DNA-binding LacI/PurR family transcriptional regulator
MTTLKHIAERAGVTVSVVSRALNSRPDKHARVAPDTKNRIEEAARALGFRRNRGAEFLKRGKSPVIQVLLPARSDSLMAELMYGMAEVAEAEDFSLGFSFGVNGDGLSSFLDLALKKRNCGVLAYSHEFDAACWEHIGSDVMGAMKMVTINPRHPVPAGFPTLSVGYREGGALAARRLLDRGCSSLAALGKTDSRIEGFAEEAKKTVPSISLFDSPDHESFERWLRSAPRPAGLFAATDLLALKTLSRLHQMGLAVPADVRLIGYDDLDFASHTSPQLTTIRQEFREEGREAVRMIVRHMYGEVVNSKVIPPSLVVRESA